MFSATVAKNRLLLNTKKENDYLPGNMYLITICPLFPLYLDCTVQTGYTMPEQPWRSGGLQWGLVFWVRTGGDAEAWGLAGWVEDVGGGCRRTGTGGCTGADQTSSCGNSWGLCWRGEAIDRQSNGDVGISRDEHNRNWDHYDWSSKGQPAAASARDGMAKAFLYILDLGSYMENAKLP